MSERAIYVARHGETHWNVEGRMQGRMGGELTSRGRAQADALADFAERIGVKRLLASSLNRAVATASVVGERLGLPVVRVDDLVEIDFGACSGLRETEIDSRFPGLREARTLDKWNHRWPDGESYADALVRVRRFCARGALDLTGAAAEPTLVIGHQSVNRVLSLALSGARAEDVLAMAQPSDVILRFAGGAHVAHAHVALGEPPGWTLGLYLTAKPKLN